MRDKNGRVVYYLFFATNNALGHVKMKESMWKVDPLGEFKFSDATNPDQQVLFSEPPTAGLANDLASRFTGQPEMQIAAVETYVQSLSQKTHGRRPQASRRECRIGSR